MKDLNPPAANLSGSPVTAVAVGHQPTNPCSRSGEPRLRRVHRR